VPSGGIAASVKIRGIDHVRGRLQPDNIDNAIRPAFEASAVLVEGDAKRAVHRVTGKLQGSLGHEVTGSGFNTQASIGPQPGLAQPRHYAKSQTGRWKKPRDGVNKGDAQVYGRYEEEGTRYRPAHPFLVPALLKNGNRIVQIVSEAFARVFR